jgi:hypothetical protein
MSNGTSAPDLLRRFVPAPHVCNLFAGGSCVRLETNDPSIVTAMRSVTAPSPNENGRVSYSWKLIRDEEGPSGGREITILSSGPLSTLLLSMGTVIAIDRERREVLGFIAPDVSAEEFVSSWLPLITQLLVATESGVSQ